MQMTINPLNFLIKETESGFLWEQLSYVFLHGKPLKSPCALCVAAAYCCGAVALCVTAALLGRFLPRLGPPVHNKRPFFLGPPVSFQARENAKRRFGARYTCAGRCVWSRSAT